MEWNKPEWTSEIRRAESEEWDIHGSRQHVTSPSAARWFSRSAFQQEALLSQRDRTMFRGVIEYFAKSFKVTPGHSKSHPFVGRVYFMVTVSVSVTFALDLPLRTNKLHSVLSSSWWSVHGGRSQLLFALRTPPSMR